MHLVPGRRYLPRFGRGLGSDDRLVQPRESAWHTFWKWGGKRKQADIVDWRETDGYKGDWLGLQTLDKQGKLEFNMYQGTHTSYNQTWWQSTVMPVFNTNRRHELFSFFDLGSVI